VHTQHTANSTERASALVLVEIPPSFGPLFFCTMLCFVLHTAITQPEGNDEDHPSKQSRPPDEQGTERGADLSFLAQVGSLVNSCVVGLNRYK
jgi:hypothetical protein